MKVGSLFAGIGGFDLAARWVGWDTVWYSEIDPYASAVMKKQFPRATNHGDITKIDGRTIEPVDLLCGGFPCQDISLAGKGAGLTGERSGLWVHFARLIQEIAPRWVVIENVSALRSRGLDQVLGRLAALGYDAEWHCIPAAYVGAPHRRDRIWITAWQRGWLADTECLGSAIGRAAGYVARTPGETEGDGEERQRSGNAADDRGTVVADADSHARHQGWSSDTTEVEGRRNADRSGVNGSVSHTDSGSVERGRGRISESSDWSGWWSVEPDVGRVAHGVPSRVDRLRCLGNAIVPQVAAIIFAAINQREGLGNQ